MPVRDTDNRFSNILCINASFYESISTKSGTKIIFFIKLLFF